MYFNSNILYIHLVKFITYTVWIKLYVRNSYDQTYIIPKLWTNFYLVYLNLNLHI